MTTIQNTFASNVRKYRKAAHLSQEKLAELAGLHRTYIGGIEQQRVNVSLKNIGKIADALNVDPAVLFLLPDDAVGGVIRTPVTPPAALRKPVQPGNDEDSSDYALVTWHEGQVVMRPIEVAYEDLTLQVLCKLILDGHQGSDLRAHYSQVHAEIIEFLESTDT